MRLPAIPPRQPPTLFFPAGPRKERSPNGRPPRPCTGVVSSGEPAPSKSEATQARAVPLASGQCPRIPLSCVKPGLTGPWRFPEEDGSGRPLPPEVEYVQDYSLWLDLGLLLGSLKRSLLGRSPVPLVGRAEAEPQAVPTRALLPPEGKSRPRAPQEWVAR